MTQAAIIDNTGLMIQKQDLTPSLFDNFIKWIDRGEKTTRTYIVNLRQFIAWLRYSAITKPERQDIISYRQYLCTEHEAIQLDGLSWKYRTDKSGNPVKVICKPNTIKQYLQSVRQFFKWTAAEGLYPNIAENIHAPKVKHDTHRKEALTAAEVQTIENSITCKTAESLNEAEQAQKDTEGRMQRAVEKGKRLYAMYLLTVTAGLRTIEISRANIKDLEEKGGCTYLYIWGKGHTEADTKKALAPEVAAAIKDYLQSRTDHPTRASPLFVATGNRSKGKRIAATTISTMLKGAMKEAGFNSERLTAHSLRHTAGTNAMQLTGDLYATQQYMRHSNPATTEIYLHIDTEQKEAEIAQRLYNHYHGIDNAAGSQEQLQETIQKMSKEQLEQLAAIAKAICK